MLPEVCEMSPYLAYAMIIYCISTVYYMYMTRDIGTPFNDSLTDEQREIKKQSASIRRSIFYQGLGVGLVLIILFRPFAKCKN